jgi:hypothetical protein
VPPFCYVFYKPLCRARVRTANPVVVPIHDAMPGGGGWTPLPDAVAKAFRRIDEIVFAAHEIRA